jgi:DNA-binding transcriptional LysR family regulator
VDLLQLRYFQAVARREHVSRAASELHIAQPALSRTIARLEAELKVPLFNRYGRRVVLNRFGAIFLARVSRALGELEEARKELDDAAGLARGNVAVAAETLRLLTDPASRFLQAHPNVSLRLKQSTAPVMSNQLDTGDVDLCIASQHVEGPSVEAIELFTEEVLLAVPPGHPLARCKRVNVEELTGVPFVTPRPGYWPRTLIDRLLSDAGVPLTIACEGDEPAAVRGLISAGVGVGLLPAVARRVAPHPRVAWLRLTAPGGCKRTLSIVWRRDRYLSAAVKRFREFAVDYFRQRPADD